MSKMRIKDYELCEEIGRGGIGVVYKARQIGLERFVALKLLNEEYAHDDVATTIFLEQSKAMGMLSHPNIVHVHDAGVDEKTGLVFCVQELIEGASLKDDIRKGLLPFEYILDLSLHIANALDYSHQHGIVHLDLKPANILIDPDSSEPKITDFGTAIMYGKDGSRSSPQTTRKSIAVCTPEYMSPEQRSGSKPDKRSDIYSFGEVLYEMLTGNRHSFPYIRPSQSNVNVPKNIDDIVERCLFTDSGRRYQSAADLSDDLAEVKQSKWKYALTETRKLNRRLNIVSTAFVAGVIGIATALTIAPSIKRENTRSEQYQYSGTLEVPVQMSVEPTRIECMLINTPNADHDSKRSTILCSLPTVVPTRAAIKLPTCSHTATSSRTATASRTHTPTTSPTATCTSTNTPTRTPSPVPASLPTEDIGQQYRRILNLVIGGPREDATILFDINTDNKVVMDFKSYAVVPKRDCYVLELNDGKRVSEYNFCSETSINKRFARGKYIMSLKSLYEQQHSIRIRSSVPLLLVNEDEKEQENEKMLKKDSKIKSLEVLLSRDHPEEKIELTVANTIPLLDIWNSDSDDVCYVKIFNGNDILKAYEVRQKLIDSKILELKPGYYILQLQSDTKDELRVKIESNFTMRREENEYTIHKQIK